MNKNHFCSLSKVICNVNPFSASQLSTTNFSLYNTYKIWHLVMRKWELIKQSKLLKIKSQIISNLFNEKYGLRLGEFKNTTGTERVKKNTEPMMGFEPTTFRTPDGRSIHSILSIIGLKRRYYVAIVIYLFISKPLPKLIIIYWLYFNYNYLKFLTKLETLNNHFKCV